MTILWEKFVKRRGGGQITVASIEPFKSKLVKIYTYLFITLIAHNAKNKKFAFLGKNHGCQLILEILIFLVKIDGVYRVKAKLQCDTLFIKDD